MPFEFTDVFITSDGRIVLDCPISSESFIANQASFKIYIWNIELSTLSDIAKIRPRLIHSMFNRWTYI